MPFFLVLFTQPDRHIRDNADNPYSGVPDGITIIYRTVHPSRLPNRSLLPWRFSLRVQPFIRSRCSQCIVIRFGGAQ
jgi:hypothetical protein